MNKWKPLGEVSFPPIETTIFVILATITVFRRQLSSNDRYRARSSANFTKFLLSSRRNFALLLKSLLHRLDAIPSIFTVFLRLITKVVSFDDDPMDAMDGKSRSECLSSRRSFHVLKRLQEQISHREDIVLTMKVVLSSDRLAHIVRNLLWSA